MSDKQTTKYCPVCGNTDLALFRSMNEKVCTNHHNYVIIPWYLDEGQTPLFGKTSKNSEDE